MLSCGLLWFTKKDVDLEVEAVLMGHEFFYCQSRKMYFSGFVLFFFFLNVDAFDFGLQIEFRLQRSK